MKYRLTQLLTVVTGAGVWSLLISMETARYDLEDTGRWAAAAIWHACAVGLTCALIGKPKMLSRPTLVLAGLSLPYWAMYCLGVSCYLAGVELPDYVWGVTDVLLLGIHLPCVIAGVDLYCRWSDYSGLSTLLGVALGYLTCLLPICGFWTYLLS